MLQQLFHNQTPFEYSLSGLDLGPARCRILAQHVAYNTSLLSLDLSRKLIDDKEGVDLANMIAMNKTLRKLELEGNKLGMNSASAFGRALKQNRTLKYLDLESNQLTADGSLF